MAIVFGGVLSGFAGTSSVAQAQGACDPIDDATGDVDLDAIRAAAQPLEDRGATVVVRAYNSLPNADIDLALDELVAQCFSDGPAGVRANLILVAVAVDDRNTSIRYGAEWLELDPFEAGIQEDGMNPNFADGDITGGLAAGLEEIELILNEVNGAIQNPTSTPLPVDTEPSSSAGLAAAGLAAVGAAAGTTVLVRRRRQLTELRQELDDRIAGPRVRVGASRERAQRLNSQAQIWEHTVSGTTLDRLRERRAEARAAETETERAAALLAGATPDGIKNAKASELADARNRLTELIDTLDRAKSALDRFDSFGDQLERLRVSLPAKQSLMFSEFDEAEQLGAQRVAEGWKVEEALERLSHSRRICEGLDFAPLELDLLAMSDLLEEAEAELFAARHILQSFPDRPAALAEWAQQLEASEATERQRIGLVEREFNSISPVHATESWHWAAEYPAMASANLDKSAALRQGAMEGPARAQHFDAAGQALEQSGLELIAADDLLDEVDTLMVNLETARAQAPGVLAQAKEELVELVRFVNQHSSDLPQRFDVEPREIEIALVGLGDELRLGRPNYLVVAQTGLRIAHQIDKLFIEASDEQKRVEALRRELGRELARADRAIERAERSLGWQVIPSRDGRDLEEVRNDLLTLEGTLEQQLAQAEDITADAIAIRERIVARKRRNSTWVVVGSGGGWSGGSSRNSSSGGGWGGGSSSGGGGFGGGGFGGGGFGGGGFGGGGFGGGGSSSSW